MSEDRDQNKIRLATSVERSPVHNSFWVARQPPPDDSADHCRLNVGPIGLNAVVTHNYRASRDNHPYHVIQSLELTFGKESKFIRSFDAFRKKCNVSNYDVGGGISDRKVQEMTAIAESLREDAGHWIRSNHAALL